MGVQGAEQYHRTGRWVLARLTTLMDLESHLEQAEGFATHFSATYVGRNALATKITIEGAIMLLGDGVDTSCIDPRRNILPV
jgi:hypothetical protein